MRWKVPTVLSLALAAWVAPCRPAAAQQAGRAQAPAGRATAPAPAPQNIDPDGRRMLDLQDKWAHQSGLLKSLKVNITRTDESPAWGDKEEYAGQAQFQSPNLARIDFQKKTVVDPKTKQQKYVPHESIVCTGKDVWQYRWGEKQAFVYELKPRERKRALQEGPLPFLFNFQANDARERYRMKLVKEDEKSFVVQVIPLLPIDKECFSQALIRLDRQYLLPTQVYLIDPEQKSSKNFVLSEVKANQGVDANVFVGRRPAADWKIHLNPEGNDAAPAPAVGQNPRAVAPRPGAPAQPGAARRR